MRIQAKIKKWGNSIGLRLSGPLKSVPHFEEDMLVNIEVTENGLVVTPAFDRENKRFPFSEAELIKGLNAETVHADLLASPTAKERGEDG